MGKSYTGVALDTETGLLDYGARQYDRAVGRWFSIDMLAEATEDFSVYLYGANNPILNIDFLGLTDINDEKVNYELSLKEVEIRGKRESGNDGTLSNVQLALDGIGLIPGAGTFAGIANAGIDIYRGNYGSAGLNLVSAIPLVGTAMKGAKFAVLGYKGAKTLMAAKAVKAAIPLAIRKLSPIGTQIHHIIPKGVYKEHSAIFDQLKNFDIDNIGNLIPLNKGFHGNHPAYSEFVAKELTELASKTSNGKLTIQHITQTIDKMEGIIQKANNSSLNLNDFIKTLK